MRPLPWLSLAFLAATVAACAPPRSTSAPTPTHTEGPIVDPSVVDALLRAEREGTLVAPFAEARGLRLEDAYAVQRAVRDARVSEGDAAVGYKAAFQGGETQARLGLAAPAWAPLFASMQVAPGASVEAELPGTLLAEVEVAFTVAARIDAPLADADAARAAVSSVHVAIELPRVRFDAPPTGLDLIADGAGAHRFVVGPALPVARLSDGPRAGSLALGDVPLLEGGSGDPWAGLVTLVASVVEDGGAIEAGAVILSGALGHPVPLVDVAPPRVLRATIDGLGDVEVVLR